MSILLLVIGYVSDSDARILCEVDTDSIVSVDLNGIPVHNQWITAGRPQIIEIDNLSELTRYNIRIYTDSDERLGSFTTSPRYLHFLSCNNQAKGDHKAWNYMINLPLPDMIVHLGDQVYQDYGNDTFERACKQKTYELMVDTFRAEYRKQWNVPYMKEVLSKCSNVMLYDDHCANDSFDQKISLPHDWADKTWDELQSKYVDKEAKAIIAALLCVCEYLLSLCGIDKPRSWNIQVGGKKIGFIETRVARASKSRLVFPECDILITGVPIFMLPDGASNNFTNGLGRLIKIYDIYDQWNMHKLNMEDVIALIPKISVIITGDTHAGANTNITLNGMKIKQYVTSGIDTPTPPKLLLFLLYLFRRYKYRYSKGHVQVEHKYWIWHNNYLKIDMLNLNNAEFVVPALL